MIIGCDPIPVKVICENLPKDHYVQVQWKYITDDHFQGFFSTYRPIFQNFRVFACSKILEILKKLTHA